MAKQQKTRPDDPHVPLPDPERVQRTFEAAVERVRERRGFYIGLAVVLFLGVIAVIVAANLGPSSEPSRFPALWQRCERVREKLLTNSSARQELAELETFLDEVRGTEQEGHALWFLAIYHYREAWTPDKTSFDEREPHLRKALSFLDELGAPRFDELLLALPRTFAASTEPPVQALRAQVEKDLAWARDSSFKEPPPDADPVAVLRTSAGDIHLQFFGQLAPRHRDSFVSLARKGTYNETALHFVRKEDRGAEGPVPLGVMGGDPYSFFYNDPLDKDHILRWGEGGLGYDLPPEEARFRINHDERIVTSQMRDKADWDNAAQFMIMLDRDPALDKRHTPFAKVVEGFEVVREAAQRRTAALHGPFKDDPSFTTPTTRNLVVDPVIVHKVIVYENRKALEHDFPLSESERSLDTVASAPVEPLPPEEVYCGRRLRSTKDVAEALRPGLDIPFPDDVDNKTASAQGEWKRRYRAAGGNDGDDDTDGGSDPGNDAGRDSGADAERGGG